MELKKYLNETDTDLKVKRIVDDCLQKIAHINAKFKKGEDSIIMQKAVLKLYGEIEKAQRNYNRVVF